LPALGNDPARYTAALVREAFINYCRSAASRHYPRIMATALRGYLRFLAARGDCPADLACAIPTTKHWRLSALPRYLPAGDVERLIASCEVSRPGGLRDRAILLLLARLGLRAKDISALHLEDIEWDEGALRVRGKGRRVVRLPLPQDAGDALLEYVMYARPAAAATDIVFLRLLPPYTPFTRSRSVSCVVDRALDRAGIMHAPSRGTNLLRHSAATAMLRGGATLEAIGTVLRHRSIDTTAHYAKVDLGMLGSIAQPWTVVETAACHDRADMARLFRIAQPWPGDVSC
jgi:integrase/recombinase XerD